ncbi:DoxX family protein [Chitinophaga arvensicola]|uniref:DoxX-like family protein n=1 Tax=Chitinophaga arvensicola TaxID=29529 RepID=A0A1I0S996_9BACT|nr:DoxX family protein [Chitinophaga arvensicola]SEW52727.1 DoxX-like family protein [Chitinophaga arvensicola]
MTSQQKHSKLVLWALWAAQALLAAGFIWAAAMKLFLPVTKLSAMWPWTAQLPVPLVKGTGIIDLLGGTGILLPSLLRIQPRFTAFTAIGIIALMIAAGIFHIARGEASLIGVNIVFAIIATFIVWGRWIPRQN